MCVYVCVRVYVCVYVYVCACGDPEFIEIGKNSVLCTLNSFTLYSVLCTPIMTSNIVASTLLHKLVLPYGLLEFSGLEFNYRSVFCVI